jgi:hypothetical protein
MRGSRRTPPKDNETGSAGDRLRDALARKQAGDETREQDETARQQDAFRQSLSKWFNDVAAELPRKIGDITAALEASRRVSTDLSYSAADTISVRGVNSTELSTLPGFQALDKACHDLNVACSVAAGRYGYGRKSTAGQEYLHVNIDAAQPYHPVTVEKPLPPGSRRFR